jgi:hypothetical protein
MKISAQSVLRSVSEKCMERKVRFVWDFDLPVLGKSSTYRADTLQNPPGKCLVILFSDQKQWNTSPKYTCSRKK